MDLKERINDMKTQIEQVKAEEKSLAYELLEDSKKHNKRSFILIVILIIALFLSNVGWLLYINQFDFITTTETTQEMSDVDNSNDSQEVN